MATQVNFFQPGTEAGIDANAIARQRKLAEAMLWQGQQSPQGQMVSGHYVAPGAMSYINQLAQALGGAFLGRRADEAEALMGERLRAKNAADAEAFTRAMQGTPEVSREVDGPAVPGQEAPRQIMQEAIPADQNRALAIALASQNPLLQGMAPKMLEQQMADASFQKVIASAVGAGGAPGSAAGVASPGNALGIDPQAFALLQSKDPRAQAMAKAILEMAKPMALGEGGTLIDPRTGQPRYIAPKTEVGINMVPIAGQPGAFRAAPVEGYAQAKANIAGQVAGAEAQARDPYAGLVRIGDRWMTPAQAREAAGGGQPQAPQMPAAQPGVTGNFTGDPSQVAAAIAGIRDPQERANALAAFEEQMRRGSNAPGPVAPMQPGIAVPSEAQQTYDKSRAESYAKMAPQLQEDGRSGASAIRNLDQLQDIYKDKNIAKGALAENISGLKNLAASFGVEVAGLGGEQAAEAITNKMALAARSTADGGGMPGAMSEGDRKFLANMQPGLSKTPEGRDRIMSAMRKVAQRQIDVANLAREYEQRNGRLDLGFDKVLADFASKHPMFTQGANIDWSKVKIERAR